MSINVPYREEHLTMARELAAEMEKNDGLAPVNLEQFWEDDKAAHANPFGDDIPQVPMGCRLTGECVFAENGVEFDMWRYQHDTEWRLQLNKAFNDKAEKIVGRRWLGETVGDNSKSYPGTYGLTDVFEAKNEWHDNSWWLKQNCFSEDDLKALLDRVDEKDIRSVVLPENWDEEKERLMALGVKPPQYRGQRGPVTFAASIYGSEPLIELILLNPDLAVRFNDTILRVMLEIRKIFEEEAGYTDEDRPHGFGFADDNCCLMTPEMYEIFGWPVLKGIFDYCSPDPGDTRFQHSDSPMAQLLPLLGKLGMTGLNLGPTVMFDEIREHCPKAVVSGCLAPFTYSRNEYENIVLEFLRDFEMAKETRGLRFATAGSINDGSSLKSMRLVMAAIQRYGRYS